MDLSRWYRLIAATVILGGALSVTPLYAQRRGNRHDGRSERTAPVERTHPRADQSPPPTQLEQDFAPPDPTRPWGPPRYLNRYRHRPYGHRGFHDRRWYYDDDYSYRFGRRRDGNIYDENLERAYRQGVSDGRHSGRFEIQAERGFANYEDAMARGHTAFGAGDYAPSLRHFLLAATLNQGDPTSRLCAAHARFALGDYGTAGRLLRRAFELQPRIMYLPMDIRTAYGDQQDFRRHRRALRRAVRTDVENGDLWFLLGYVYFFSDDMPKAADALTRSAELMPEDRLVARLADLAGTGRSHPEGRPTEREPLEPIREL